jgi:hypothetical protein
LNKPFCQISIYDHSVKWRSVRWFWDKSNEPEPIWSKRPTERTSFDQIWPFLRYLSAEKVDELIANPKEQFDRKDHLTLKMASTRIGWFLKVDSFSRFTFNGQLVKFLSELAESAPFLAEHWLQGFIHFGANEYNSVKRFKILDDEDWTLLMLPTNLIFFLISD